MCSNKKSCKKQKLIFYFTSVCVHVNKESFSEYTEELINPPFVWVAIFLVQKTFNLDKGNINIIIVIIIC